MQLFGNVLCIPITKHQQHLKRENTGSSLKRMENYFSRRTCEGFLAFIYIIITFCSIILKKGGRMGRGMLYFLLYSISLRLEH